MLTLAIVIPTKDRPLFVRAAALAALDAVAENGRVIVVDDHGEKPATDALADINDPRLKILRNTGDHGPSNARNFGVAQAKSDLILFADDDDLLKPGYPAHIIGLAQSARYGFCATENFTSPPTQTPPFKAQNALDIGTLPFRKQLGGLGCGFWIYRKDFQDVGGIDPRLLVNEDTDFSIRLLAANLAGTFETGIGVMIRQHISSRASGDLGQITKRANSGDRADYFAAIIAQNAPYLNQRPTAKRYLTKRLVKMRAKAGQIPAGISACNGSPPLLLYFFINYLAYRINGE
tara:strand:- start:1621 stop:2493 length:873 start_codon:yes stop_codon:yes gene_type:complete